jgi:hypothetical protein
MPITEKPYADRIKETVEILQTIRGLGIPIQSPEVNELKGHLDSYIKDGICWSGTINFQRFGRMAEVNLPRRADKQIEVTLRVPRV